MSEVKMFGTENVRRLFKVERVINIIILLIAVTVFFYSLKFRVDAMENQLASIKKVYVHKEVYQKDVEYIKESLQEIKADIKEIRKR